VRVWDEMVRVEVLDGGPRAPELRWAGRDAEGGPWALACGGPGGTVGVADGLSPGLSCGAAKYPAPGVTTRYWRQVWVRDADRSVQTQLREVHAFGLPPRRSWAALQQALAQWRAGTADACAYDVPVAAARSAYAQLAGVDPSAVAVGSQVSVFAGLIAANLPDGSEVLTAAGDFTSILFPFYAQSGRGIRVRELPLAHIADAVTSRTTLVAVSAVQSADGRVADLDALHAASRATGARVLLDTTQAVGWLPVDASRFAYTACGGYK
jgi:Aminotransferase class-V